MNKKNMLLAPVVILFTGATLAAVNPSEDLCSNIAGSWSGTGSYTDHALVKCNYSGTLTIKGSNEFTGEGDLNQVGTGVCISLKGIGLKGTCENGKISLKAGKLNLKGDVKNTDDGKHVDLTGKFGTFDVTIKADKKNQLTPLQPKLKPLTNKLKPLEQKIAH